MTIITVIIYTASTASTMPSTSRKSTYTSVTTSARQTPLGKLKRMSDRTVSVNGFC